MQGNIEIKNACVHNLKGVDVEIPRNKLVVVTGPSGSGKSSLAFDTLYAEGQRRYVESLSAYVRQFLGRMHKPEVDYIKGLPPAIAIQQRVISNNPRSTVGTVTEIYEYLKLLFARIGRTFSPVSGEEVKRHQVSDVIDFMVGLKEGTTAYLLSPLDQSTEKSLSERLQLLLQQGFNRVALGEQFFKISDLLKADTLPEGDVAIVVDRIQCKDTPEMRNRLADSVQTAFYENGKQCCDVLYDKKDGTRGCRHFSQAFEADGIKFEEPVQQLFSFNNPIGACPCCNGDGFINGIDPNLVIPDTSRSVYNDAVACWRGEVSGLWKKQLINGARKSHFPIHTPISDLTKEQYEMLWSGTKDFDGIDQFFAWIDTQQYKIQYRVMKARYRGRTVCRACGGSRLRKEATYVRIGGKNISELVAMPVSELQQFFAQLTLSEHEQNIAKRLLVEITNRLSFLVEVGLGYLTLSRASATLSGGESQRINLATSLGSALVGSLYVLDEPSIGLHPRDTKRLIGVLRKLQQMNNTVVVVEHDNDIIHAADQLIDIGPAAGRHGGEIVWNGNVNDATEDDFARSVTLRYVTGRESIPIPKRRRPIKNFIEIQGARSNNLKNVDVRIPLGIITVVTGVSGSGKSTLVRDVLYNALNQMIDNGETSENSHYKSLSGSLHLLKHVEFVSQKPIGKSTRSNPVTYIKAYDDIRKLFADQPLSKQMRFTAGHFSFNHEGGRCEVCQGEGTVTVPMQFMADLVMECEACKGRRFKNDVLDVRFRGKSIYDVLEMTINQAIDFFSSSNGSLEQKIAQKLKPLQDVGIGYLKMGQSSSTLSGGENQRVKLAEFLSNEQSEPTLFIFDEPTTGLHSCDIVKLLEAFNALISHGHTVVVIEHNLDIIKCADHIIDLGPEGGAEGGYIVASGTPEQVAKAPNSYTAKYLNDILEAAQKSEIAAKKD
ncbi:MAG: excinuclease ABC subunit UvrA [Bacteroidales bacterium]|nr:excinuclease ABC subunit UvrA [Bacteroidales bacterium]